MSTYNKHGMVSGCVPGVEKSHGARRVRFRAGRRPRGVHPMDRNARLKSVAGAEKLIVGRKHAKRKHPQATARVDHLCSRKSRKTSCCGSVGGA